ncbi:MAG: CpsD/CapB family tyrosine-protein kinase [Chloroflexi bacterium]|nr:CpsD/CapB family tyrosine-protein kinase [Chloroflexota bacterium]
MAAPDLITLKDPRSPAAEAYRTLRANLMNFDQTRPVTAFVVTSAQGADGKSEATANLAAVFALAGHRTILVDGDLRKPQQQRIWGVDNARGLGEMFADDVAMSNPPLVQTAVENLSLLPAGTSTLSPSDLFANPRLNDIIGVLRARANYVIFDAPPALAVSDAALLGVRLDGAILIAKAGSTRRDHLARATEALERVHVRVLGAVLTDAPRERRADYR